MNTTTPQSLTQQASRGAFWSLAGNVSVSAISFCGTAVLARMLEPKDFGLIGMAVLVTGVVQLFGNFGLGAALVQKKEVTEEELSTVFWANMAAGTTLAVICAAISPLMARFFREPNVMWVLIALAVNFILSALSSVHSTLVYKHLRMKSMSAVTVAGRILRVGVMLIAAFAGFKFWSIVIGMLVERAFMTGAYFFLEAWRPGRVFSVEKFKSMFKFGRNLMAGGFLVYVHQNIDFTVTGRVLGANLLGFYQMAFNLPSLLRNYVNDSVGSVSFPVFCKISGDDNLSRAYLKVVRVVSLGTFPLFFGLSFTARDFVFLVYGEKWLPAAFPMSILCFGFAFGVANTALWSLLCAKGRPDLALKWDSIRMPASVVLVLMGASLNGIVGVAWGMLASEFVHLGCIYQILRILNSDFREYLKAFVPATVSSVLMLGVLWLLRSFFLADISLVWLRFSLVFVAGAAVYIGVFFFVFRESYEVFIKMVRGLIGRV